MTETKRKFIECRFAKIVSTKLLTKSVPADVPVNGWARQGIAED